MKRGSVLLVGLALAGCGSAPRHAAKAAPTAAPPQLPGGGRYIFAQPKRRIVAFYGNPQDPQLGTLGIGRPGQAARRLVRVAHEYATPNRPVLPAFELLSAVADYAPGPNGLYRSETSNHVIRRYLRAARRVHALLILDIQPGRASFVPEARRLARWLRKPDVSLALDPEWHVGPGELPGKVIGSVDASEVMQVGAWLDGLTAKYDLPQKVLVVHQFTEGMIKRKPLLHPFRHVAFVLNQDGFGTAPVKVAKYKRFARFVPFAFNGFKLFYQEDTGLMTPRQVLRVRPTPDMVVYE